MSLPVLVKAGDRVRFADKWCQLSRDPNAVHTGEIVSTNRKGGAVMRVDGAKFSPPLVYIQTRFITHVEKARVKAHSVADAAAGLRRMLGAV